jgi:hypothetical protein
MAEYQKIEYRIGKDGKIQDLIEYLCYLR